MTTTELPGAKPPSRIQTPSAPGFCFTDGQPEDGIQDRGAVGELNLPATSEVSTPMAAASRAPQLPRAIEIAAPNDLPPGDPNSDVAIDSMSTQTKIATPDTTGSQMSGARPGGILRDPVLGVLSDVLDDFETVRIANANRVRILTRTEEDGDGESRGWGLTEEHPEVAKLLLTLKALESAEHDSTLNLQRALRKHPLAVVQKRYRGLGEKQFARMLATVGDPYWNDLHGRPRTVSELWAYCGLDVRNGEAPKRQRGQQSNWSEDARKRLYVISASLTKGGRMADDKRGPQDPVADKYRLLYDATKAKYADSVHPVDCKRCGPAGKPALAGTPRSAAHIHAVAIRAMSKELLKELWREARDIYEERAA